MIRRIWTAYRVEILKAIRLKFTYVGPLAILIVVLCLPKVYPFERDGVGDYGFIGFATPFALDLLGLLLLLMYCATLVSAELGSGVLRTVLVRPLTRTEFLLAKLLLGTSYGLVLLAVAGLSSWGLVLLRGDLCGVSIGEELIYTNQEMVMAYLEGAALSLLPQLATVAYAIMISSLTRSTGAAVGSAVGIWLLVDLVKRPLGLAPMLFSTYIEMPWQVFVNHADGIDAAWWPGGLHCIVTSVVSLAVFVFAAICHFRRRNLNL